VREPEPLLCVPFTGIEKLRADLQESLAAMDFDPARNAVGPEETATNPLVALEVRLSVLSRTYRGDYHTDSFDLERLAGQIQDGDEAIWFWGHASEIARLRAVLRGEDDARALSLGTVTVLSVEAEFGPGHGELCRSGSQSDFNARGAIVYRTLGYIDGRERWLRARYHTLTLVPRNRPSTDQIRGGEAIHRIHARHVQSRFWGFAPWYVMHGGVLELLDHRESNRDPNDVIAGLDASVGWYFADPEEAAYAEALCRVNFDRAPRISVSQRQQTSPGLAAELHLPPSAGLTRFNHGTLVVGRGAGGLSVEHGLERLAAVEVCCAVVRLPLDDEDAVPLQRTLRQRGFRLTSIRPPKKTWLLKGETRIPVETTACGFWSRPRVDLEVVPPYYRECEGKTGPERTVMRYLRDHLDFTNNGRMR
jgi:hypothetical protein